VFLGDLVEYRLDWEEDPLVIRCPPTDGFQEGDSVFISVDPDRSILLEEEARA
jgi:hypothetical protein